MLTAAAAAAAGSDDREHCTCSTCRHDARRRSRHRRRSAGKSLALTCIGYHHHSLTCRATSAAFFLRVSMLCMQSAILL